MPSRGRSRREREREGGGEEEEEKGRLIALASNSCHPWLGGRRGSEVWGYRRRQLDATVPLDTANSAGSLPPVPGCSGCSGSAEDRVQKKKPLPCECVNEPRCFRFFRKNTNPHQCYIRAWLFFFSEIDALVNLLECLCEHEIIPESKIHIFNLFSFFLFFVFCGGGVWCLCDAAIVFEVLAHNKSLQTICWGRLCY